MFKRTENPDALVLAEDYAKKYDAQWDRIYAAHLAKRVCAIDNEINALYFRKTKMVVFHVKNLIIHKVILNKDNSTEESLKNHVAHVEKIVRMMKAGLFNAADIRPAKVDWTLGKEI